jgi:hypothetical protein
MEIQIGHPFASVVFSNDSKIRDMEQNNEDTSNIVDLWDELLGSSETPYHEIKRLLLADANGHN